MGRFRIMGEARETAEEELVPADELERKVVGLLNGYYMIGARKDRFSFYALTKEELKTHPACICGLFINLVMDGELDKAEEMIDMLEDIPLLHESLVLVYPKSSMKRLLSAVDILVRNDFHVFVVLNVGRPSVLNGFGDFTRLGPFLERHKDRFIEGLRHMYEEELAQPIYSLLLAEWYYQQNRLTEAGDIVNKVIDEFDNDQQRRLLFVALYLQSRILFASGKVENPLGYIRNIRHYVREKGNLEFSYNIDTAETCTALVEGNYELVSRWMEDDAPDEFSDFNMLDLYRYMVKMRCYIVNKKYMALLALAERLRPLLEEGNRLMDLCELDLLLAISFFRAEEKEYALQAFERAIALAKRRGYFRLVVDEGAAILPLLICYVKHRGETPFLMKLVESARDMAANYPLYLKSINKAGATFSKMEVNVLKFLEQGKSKEEIADYFFVSVNTIKFHMKNIYKKLDASSPHQAVWEAQLLGII